MKQLTIFIYFLFFISLVKSQPYNLFLKDSDKVSIQEWKIGDFRSWDYRFIKILEDGDWLFYSTLDSEKPYPRNLKLTGNYKNHKKNGLFITYFDKIKGNKNEFPPIESMVNYKDDEYDGQFVLYLLENKLYEGAYVNGKRNGFFIEYFNYSPFLGKIKKIAFYKEDSLQNWSVYGENGKIKNQGCGSGNSLNDVLLANDSNGRVIQRAYFTFGKLDSVEVFNQLELKKFLMGEFYPIKDLNRIDFGIGRYSIDLENAKLKNGFIKIYKNGILQSTVKIKDGLEYQ